MHYNLAATLDVSDIVDNSADNISTKHQITMKNSNQFTDNLDKFLWIPRNSGILKQKHHTIVFTLKVWCIFPYLNINISNNFTKFLNRIRNHTQSKI